MGRSVGAVLIGLAAASVLTGEARAQTSMDDPFIGTWVINLERSTYTGARPAANQLQRRQYSVLDNGWQQMMLTSETPLGEPTFQVSVFREDGRPYPVHSNVTLGPFMSTGEASNLTRSYRRLEGNSVEFITYTDGVAGLPSVRVMQPGGNTFFETTRGTNAGGVAINNVLVFDRVR
jgi:hypothetical protein